MSYRVAWDSVPENPNPHALDAESRGHDTEDEAQQAAEAELKDQREEMGYRDDELPSYTIVNVPDPPVLSGVYVVLVGPDISDDPVRWCFVDETDADDFAEALDESATVTFEPIAASLDDKDLGSAFPEAVEAAREIARAKE